MWTINKPVGKRALTKNNLSGQLSVGWPPDRRWGPGQSGYCISWPFILGSQDHQGSPCPLSRTSIIGSTCAHTPTEHNDLSSGVDCWIFVFLCFPFLDKMGKNPSPGVGKLISDCWKKRKQELLSRQLGAHQSLILLTSHHCPPSSTPACSSNSMPPNE